MYLKTYRAVFDNNHNIQLDCPLNYFFLQIFINTKPEIIMKRMKLCILLFVVIFSQSIFAQEKTKEEKPEFKINAELRTRANILDGYKKLPTDNNTASFVIEQRTQLGFAYKTKQLEMKITMQDARIWGDENVYTSTGTFGDSASIDLKEAWAKLTINDYWDFKVGRQALQLENGRLVSYRNRSFMGLSYDAALLKFNKNNLSIDIAMSYNNSLLNLFMGEYNPAKMKSLNYIHIKKKFNPNFHASLSSIFSGFQAENSVTTIQFKTTIGSFAKFDNKKLFAQGEFYYQTGKTIDGVDVNAYFFGSDLGYNFGKIYIGAGIDYMSGQDPNKNINEEFQAFDILYGTRFKFYGNLNYVVNPESTKYGGLINPFFRLNAKFNKKHSLKTTFLMFQSAQDVANPDSPGEFYESSLGSEIDIMYIAKISKEIKIKAGYSIAFPTETMEIFKGIEPGTSNTPQYFYLTFTFKPTLFSNKW